MILLRLIVAVPLLLLAVLFALSNRTPVHLGLWPTDYAIMVPVSLAILFAMGVAFLIGGVVLWINVLGARGRARSTERARQRLQDEIVELKADLAAARTRAELARAELARAERTRLPALVDQRG